MDKNILNMFANESDNDVRKIIGRSSRAICGPQEREIVVKDKEVFRVKAKLEKAGFFIVGTGPAGTGRKKVWFNPRVSL